MAWPQNLGPQLRGTALRLLLWLLLQLLLHLLLLQLGCRLVWSRRGDIHLRLGMVVPHLPGRAEG